MVQWLGFCTLTAECLGLIPGQGPKIPQASQCSQKKKKGKVTDGETWQAPLYLSDLELTLPVLGQIKIVLHLISNVRQ